MSLSPDTCFTTTEITRIFHKFQQCEHLQELADIDAELINNQQRQIKNLIEQKKACMVLAEAWHEETGLYKKKYKQANRGRTFYKITSAVLLVSLSVISIIK